MGRHKLSAVERFEVICKEDLIYPVERNYTKGEKYTVQDTGNAYNISGDRTNIVLGKNNEESMKKFDRYFKRV